MLVKKISFVRPNVLDEIADIEDYNLDVFVELEDGYTYTVVIATAKNIVSLINKEKTNFLEPGDPFIIVRKLTKEIIEEAVKAYAENNAYWLKLYHFAGEVDTAVFNRLQGEHTEYLNGLDELDNS
jgi:hypothetical protein